MLDSRGVFYTVQLAFFAVALVLCIPLAIHYGIKRQSVWVLLSILAILRIVGSAAIVYAETKQDDSTTLLETAAITSAIGTAPLLFSLMDGLQALLAGQDKLQIRTRWFRILQVLGTIAVILAIVGGVREAHGQTSGKPFLEGAAVIFLGMFLAILLILIMVLTSRPKSDPSLFMVCVLVTPFILLRVIYTLCVGFSNPGSTFYFEDPNVYVAAFMQFLPEGVVTVIFVGFGLVRLRGQPQAAKHHEHVPLSQGSGSERINMY